jgi:hypothetical protein
VDFLSVTTVVYFSLPSTPGTLLGLLFICRFGKEC